MPPTRSSTELPRGSSSVRASAATPRRRKESIARDGWPKATDRWGSLRFVLFQGVPERLLSLLYVFQGQSAGFHEVRHHQLGSAAEYRQQLVDEAALCVITRDHGLENIRVADALDATERFLPLQAIDDRLHGCVSRSARLGKRL